MKATEATFSDVVGAIRSVAEPSAIILFGSYARGHANDQSDIDLLVIRGKDFRRGESRRKEIGRLSARLREQGQVATTRARSDEEAALYCEEFLALEAAGWKGRAGSALASCPAKAAFFRDAIAGAQAAGRLAP